MLAIGDSGSNIGSSDEHPIELADVHLADGTYQEITAEGFELALRTLYPE